MSSKPDHRQFFLASDKTVPPEMLAKPRFRESIATVILGCLSCSLGIVVLIVVINGVRGTRVNEWHTAKSIYHLKLINYLEPSSTCAIAVVVGELLGLAGIAMAWSRNRTISFLCILGTTMCLSHIFIFFAHFILI